MNELLTFFAEMGLIDSTGITSEDLKEAITEVAVTGVGFAIFMLTLCLLLANL